MDNFCTLCLKDAAHDIDGGIVPIKQSGGGYYADFMDGCSTHYQFTLSTLCSKKWWLFFCTAYYSNYACLLAADATLSYKKSYGELLSKHSQPIVAIKIQRKKMEKLTGVSFL